MLPSGATGLTVDLRSTLSTVDWALRSLVILERNPIAIGVGGVRLAPGMMVLGDSGAVAIEEKAIPLFVWTFPPIDRVVGLRHGGRFGFLNCRCWPREWVVRERILCHDVRRQSKKDHKNESNPHVS